MDFLFDSGLHVDAEYSGGFHEQFDAVDPVVGGHHVIGVVGVHQRADDFRIDAGKHIHAFVYGFRNRLVDFFGAFQQHLRHHAGEHHLQVLRIFDIVFQFLVRLQRPHLDQIDTVVNCHGDHVRAVHRVDDLLVVYKRHTFSLYIVRPARTAVIPDRD